MMSDTHELKTWPEYYEFVARGEKTFEFRKFDRDFKVGDYLILKEFDSHINEDLIVKGYTGNKVTVKITYISDPFPVHEIMYVILSIKVV